MKRAHALALGASLIMQVSCGRGESGEESVQAVVRARTAPVSVQPFVETIGAIGTVAARAGHQAAVSAPAAALSAPIVRVFVSVGQSVSAGAPLVELSQTSFSASVDAADAALAAAEQAYARAQRLVQQGIAPRKDLEQATADVARARSEAATARQQQRLSIVRSPIGGVVTRVNATLGATPDPSQPLVEIADPTALDLLFNVTPSQAGRIRRGAKVTVRTSQRAGGELLGVATVVDVGGIVDAESRGVLVRAQAPTTRRPLRIGETVYGEIVAAVNPRALVVPREALVPDGEGFKVFVVDAAGTAHARPVTVGASTDSLAEITSGVTAGERVVTYGAYGIADSARIVPLGEPGTPGGAPRP